MEDNTAVPEAKGESSESEYFCYSSLSHLSSAEILKKQKDTPQPGESTSQEEHSAVVSSDLPCASDNKNTEFWKNQENVPQPESYVVSPGSEIAGEKSSSSEYVCISPSGKFILAKEDGKGNTQVASEQR